MLSGGFMIKRLLFLAIIMLTLSSIPASAPAQGAAEDVKARPNKQDIINQMIAAGRISAPQRNSRLDQILSGQPGKTPRSDFMFCLGSAYLGNYKAQRCLGKAYENSLGVVQDFLEAYTWYSVALENQTADKSAEKGMQSDRDRVKDRLFSSYPAPTDDDLDDMVKAQKSRIAQYQSEAKKSKN
jgi:TPR repeat protein